MGVHGGESQKLVGSDWPEEPLVVTNSIHLDQRANFEGNVAVTKASPGPMLSQNAEFALSEDATLTGSVRADTLYWGARSKVTGNAAYNGQQGSGTVEGTRTTPLSLPLPIQLPALPSITPGSQAVALTHSEARTLAAGSYGAVSLNNGNGGIPTKLVLSGGTYTFASLTLATDSRVECQSQCEVRINTRLQVSARSFVGPATGAAGVGPGNVLVLVKGSNGGSGPGATPAAVTLDDDARLHAYLLVPNGTLRIGHRVSLRGKVVAKDALLGIDLAGKGLQLPLLAQHPEDETVRERQTASFAVPEPGPGITIQWQKNGANIPGATGSTLEIPNAPVSDDGAQITVTLTNEAGSVVSNPATLTVIPCQELDTVCDGDDEDCDGEVDEDFEPYCVGGARFTCEGGIETARSCSNGVFCDGVELCEQGECVAGTPPQDDGNDCTIDECNENLDTFSHSPVPGGTPCMDPEIGAGTCNGWGTCFAPVEVFVTCVDRVGDGTFSARFGYRNPNSTSTVIPVGEHNRLVGSSKPDAAPATQL